MRYLIGLVLILQATIFLYSAEPPLTYVFTEGSETRLFFSDSVKVWTDAGGLLTIEDILKAPDHTSFRPLSAEANWEAHLTVWTGITLKNATSQIQDGYFRLFLMVDSVTMYIVENEQVIGKYKTGNAFSPREKDLLTNQNNIPVQLLPGQSRSYYFKSSHSEICCDISEMSFLAYYSKKHLIKVRISNHVIQGFYSGILLLFGLVALFMFILFRERVFIYFALLMFSYMAYFGITNYFTEYVFNRRITGILNTDLLYAISAMVLFFSLFLDSYLDLKKRFPKLRNPYLIFSFCIAPFGPIFQLFTDDPFLLVRYNNVVLIVWLLVTVSIIALSVRNRDKSSLILLLSVGVIFVGALLYTMGLNNWIPGGDWSKHAFQMGTLLFSAVLFYGLFDKINTIRSEKRRIEELDKMKSQFFANISHEFRTPLTLVMGPVKDVMEKLENESDKKRLSTAYRNAARLLQLINQLLDLSKLEAKKMRLRARKENLALILKGIVMSFDSLAESKNIRLDFTAQNEALYAYIDRDKIEKIFYNLLSNAFKFTAPQGEVAVMLIEHPEHVEILVRDSGQGIPADRQSKIFNRFFQSDDQIVGEYQGSGIGLALVKELTELHGGEITVQSTEGVGTTFTLILPKGHSHLDPQHIETFSEVSTAENASPEPIEEFAEAETAPIIISEKEASKSELPIILIIEDNNAVRAYIKEQLLGSFNVLEALNGQDGLEKAFEHLPDLVISDVMMPKMDGYEVCAALKKDRRTSHIPVILLTARAATEAKLKGLETGADDYLVKPFDSKELLVRVNNLIRLRKQLRKQFAKGEMTTSEEVSMNPVDKAFLEQAYQIIDTHLSDEQFGVDVLAREIGLSRSQLNRKLKAISDQSTNKFIQSYRLQKAKELLRTKQGNVSEVAFQTGFRSTAYFVKCFGDKFGETPGSYLQK